MSHVPPADPHPLDVTRRFFLGEASGVSLRALALGGLLSPDSHAAESSVGTAATASGLAGLPHHPPRARRVIYLTQSGGPTQIELFDHKPQLQRWFDKDLPESVRGFGHVKEKNVKAAKEREASLLAAYRRPAGQSIAAE